MDLVGFRQEVFAQIQSDFQTFLAGISQSISSLPGSDLRGGACFSLPSERSSDSHPTVQFIPISALDGDNVVTPSARAPWYQGPTLLEYLETVPVADARRDAPFRFPVQSVIRPDLHFRGFAGQIASGAVRKGDEILILPSGRTGRIKSIVTFDGELDEAFAPMSVALQLTEEIDVSRGDLFADPQSPPCLGRKFDASLVWMSEKPLQTSRAYLLKHGSQTAPARVAKILHRYDINRMTAEPAGDLRLNEIGDAQLESQRMLAFDPYAQIRQTGAFILIDPIANETAGAGMIRAAAPESEIGPVTQANGAPGSVTEPF